MASIKNTEIKIAFIMFSLIFSFSSFASSQGSQLEDTIPTIKVRSSNVIKEVFERSCQASDNTPIRVGILSHLQEPFVIPLDNGITGIYSDYISSLFQCKTQNTQFKTYSSHKELTQALDNDQIQFAISKEDPDETSMYKNVTIINEKYVAVRNTKQTDIPDAAQELTVGYVDNCFSEELRGLGYKSLNCIPYSSAIDVYRATLRGDINFAVINYLSFRYLTNKIEGNKVYIFHYFDSKFRRNLIYKDPKYAELIDIKDMSLISQIINPSWGIDMHQSYPVDLTPDEKKWIEEEKPIISVLFNSNLPPYSFFDKKGNEAGIMTDYLTKIAMKTGLKFEWVNVTQMSEAFRSLKNNIVNMGTGTSIIDGMEDSVTYSIPYAFTEISVLTRKDNNNEPYKSIAVSGTYPLQQYIKEKHADSNVIPMNTTLSAVELLINGKVDAVYGYSEVLHFLSATYFPDSLIEKVVDNNYQNDLRFIISKKYKHHETLKSILDKSIENLGLNHINKSTTKWDLHLINSESVWMEKDQKVKKLFLTTTLSIIILFSLLIAFIVKEMKRRKLISEWKLKANLIEGIPIPIAVRDSESRFVHVNKAFLEFASFENDGKNIIGRKTSEYPDEHFDDIFLNSEEKRFFDILKTSQPHQQTVRVTKDNQVLVLDEWSVPYFINGKVAGLITGWIDLTEINNLNSQLITSRDEALKANRDKSNFIAVMSHEIRTPLNAIIGSLEVSFIEDKEKCIRQAYDASLGLIDIINNILEITKMETVHSGLNMEYIKIKPLLSSVCSIFTALCNQKGLDFILDISLEEDTYIYTDHVFIRQILNNLLSNAIKYTDSGYVSVICYVHGENILIKIHDSGIGMSERQIQDMTLPFITESQHADSYGLGSTIVHRLCSSLNITMDIKSEINVGTEIQLTIPKASQWFDDGHQHYYQSNIVEHYSQDNLKLKGKKVLIIDDYDINRQLLEKQLRILNMDVVACSNGLEAWRLFNQPLNQFDMVITDCYMPDMSGFELTELIRSVEIKHMQKPIPIIGFTANSQAEVISLCLKSGMNSCIFKPITLKDLYSTVCLNLPNADDHAEIISIRRFALETGQSPHELLQVLYAALTEVEHRLLTGMDEQDTLNLVHKLKGTTRILGDFELLNICDVYEENQQVTTLNWIRERVSLLLGNLQSLVKKEKSENH